MSAVGVGVAALLTWLASGPVDARLADEISRLAGHQVAVAADGASYVIEDVAGEGAPTVGVVVRVGRGGLGLRTESGDTLELDGPLARPRIAGPGYKVWVVGDRAENGALFVRRLGVLAPPWKRPADSGVR